MKIKKGDKVRILLGKDRGKEGKVMKVSGKKEKLYIEGLNLYKRHVRKHGDLQGGILDLPKPLNISNLALVCPNCSKMTRVEFKIVDEKKTRICKKCGKAIK